MVQVLHGCATTTHAVRAAIQRSKATVPQIAERYGLNEKTVRKWRKRKTVEDAQMGPKKPRSTVLSAQEEAACVAFRRHTLLPLDDCLYALQDTIPYLTRSSLLRLYQRHGISRPLFDIAGSLGGRSRIRFGMPTKTAPCPAAAAAVPAADALPDNVSAPVNVVFQCPCAEARQRSPFGARPRKRAIFVEALVLSTKNSRSGSSSACPSNHASRATRTSSRCCSLAWPVLFCT